MRSGRWVGGFGGVSGDEPIRSLRLMHVSKLVDPTGTLVRGTSASPDDTPSYCINSASNFKIVHGLKYCCNHELFVFRGVGT